MLVTSLVASSNTGLGGVKVEQVEGQEEEVVGVNERVKEAKEMWRRRRQHASYLDLGGKET